MCDIPIISVIIYHGYILLWLELELRLGLVKIRVGVPLVFVYWTVLAHWTSLAPLLSFGAIESWGLCSVRVRVRVRVVFRCREALEDTLVYGYKIQ